jgi:hypothetical protein
VKPWLQLYQEHEKLRENAQSTVGEIRKVSREAAEKQPSIFEDPYVHSRLSQRANLRSQRQSFEPIAEPVSVWKLPEGDQEECHLDNAKLTVLLLVDRRRNHLHQLTMMVEGTRKDEDESPWTIAIHLPDDTAPDGGHQGNGDGGHALLHCHVGPDLNTQPKFRVHLPPLGAGALVEWLLSQVVPTLAFEPAPWPAVVAATKR